MNTYAGKRRSKQREFDYLEYPDQDAVKDAICRWLPASTLQLQELIALQMPQLCLRSMMPLSLVYGPHRFGKCQRLVLRFVEDQEDIPFPGESNYLWQVIVYWCWIHELEIEEKRWDTDSDEYMVRLRLQSPMIISTQT